MEDNNNIFLNLDSVYTEMVQKYNSSAIDIVTPIFNDIISKLQIREKVIIPEDYEYYKNFYMSIKQVILNENKNMQNVTNENFDFNNTFKETQNNNTNTINFTNEDVKQFVKEITGALKDRIHRNNIFLFGDGKNDSNNLQTTARYRETYRLGLSYNDVVSKFITVNSYEDAILLGNFFVHTIFDYDNNFHEFQGGKRRDIIAPNVPKTKLLYGDALYSSEEYEKILCLKLRDILNLELDKARIFFNDELTRILSEKRINYESGIISKVQTENV